MRAQLHLGVTSNNKAEADGMVTAGREAVRLHFEVLEALTEDAKPFEGGRRSSWMEM